MQYRLFAAAALAATAFAQDEADASQEAAELLSVVSVLQTALPSSLIQDALTNSEGVSSQLASEFAAGNTPSWFTALPSDVQNYLVPTGFAGPANATAITSGRVSGAPTNSANSTAFGGGSSRTTNGSDDESTISSEAGASLPTALVGMSFAGFAGLVGVLAL